MSSPRQFGGFDLYEKIGTGGMATVYRGVQRSLDRPVVLKILHPHLSEDESLIIRFEREARAAANLRHDNIVQVIDCGRQESTSYIAMEFVDGMDLKRLMETYGPPPIEMAALILRDICRGLEHAHHHRVIHRDIKPANLMLTPDGTIKIMDFGLARRGEDSVGMTATGAVLGTPAYMSPEQAMGERVDERSDIFSVGVVGYEMFGGRRPFPGDSYASVLNAILSITPDPLDRVNPQVPPEVVRVIGRMLEKDLALRYQSITEVRDELETIVERMGLVRGKDLLRRYAAAPSAVTQTLNGVRGPGGTLTVSTAVAELLTRDPLVTQDARAGAGRGLDTLVLSPESGNGDAGATAAPGAGSVTAPPSAGDRDAGRESIAAGAYGSRTGGSRAESMSVDATIPESLPDRPESRRGWNAVSMARPEQGGRRGLSKNAMIGMALGAVFLIAIVVAIFKFAGPGGDDQAGKGSAATAGLDRAPNQDLPPEQSTDKGGSSTGPADKNPVVVDPGDGLEPPRPNDPTTGATGLPGGVVKPPVKIKPSKDAVGIQAPKTDNTVVTSHKYLVNSKPFAFIHLDGSSKPLNPEGMPVTIALKTGRHTFRAVNKDLVPPVDITFEYDVFSNDLNNSLILNLGTRIVEARKNATLPF